MIQSHRETIITLLYCTAVIINRLSFDLRLAVIHLISKPNNNAFTVSYSFQ